MTTAEGSGHGPRTRRWVLLVGGAAVVIAVVAFALFRPDKLFVDQVSDEALDDDVVAALDGSSSAAEPPPATAPSPTASTDDPPATTAPATTSTAPSGPVVRSTGAWTSLNHTTGGEVAIVTEGDTSTLIFSELMTDNGPDLYVYLSPVAGATDVEGALRVDRLKGNVGTQTYELPAGTEPADFASVLIWCDRFSSGFGTATLVAV